MQKYKKPRCFRVDKPRSMRHLNISLCAFETKVEKEAERHGHTRQGQKEGYPRDRQQKPAF